MSGRQLRRPWHTLVTWQSGVGVILVRGGFAASTLERRREHARKLAQWAWGALPGETTPALETDARQRAELLRLYREAG